MWWNFQNSWRVHPGYWIDHLFEIFWSLNRLNTPLKNSSSWLLISNFGTNFNFSIANLLHFGLEHSYLFFLCPFRSKKGRNKQNLLFLPSMGRHCAEYKFYDFEYSYHVMMIPIPVSLARMYPLPFLKFSSKSVNFLLNKKTENL